MWPAGYKTAGAPEIIAPGSRWDGTARRRCVAAVAGQAGLFWALWSPAAPSPGIRVLPGPRFGGPMPRRCPECERTTPRQRPSAPRPRKMDSGGRWLRVHLERPGVLLLRRLGPGGPRGVAVAMFGHTGLGMLICRNEGVVYSDN